MKKDHMATALLSMRESTFGTGCISGHALGRRGLRGSWPWWTGCSPQSERITRDGVPDRVRCHAGGAAGTDGSGSIAYAGPRNTGSVARGFGAGVRNHDTLA